MSKNQIIVRQIGPEDVHIEIPDSVMNQVILRDSTGFVSVRQGLKNSLSGVKKLFDSNYYNIKYALEKVENGKSWEDVLREIRYYLYDGSSEGSKRLEDWQAAVKEYHPEKPVNSGLKVMLLAITGKAYRRDCAYAQSDWVDVWHPEKWDSEKFDWFESAYFRTGTEWHIAIPGGDFQIRYYNETDPAKVKQLIAKEFGAAPLDIRMQVFDGYVMTIPKYHQF